MNSIDSPMMLKTIPLRFQYYSFLKCKQKEIKNTHLFQKHTDGKILKSFCIKFPRVENQAIKPHMNDKYSFTHISC